MHTLRKNILIALTALGLAGASLGAHANDGAGRHADGEQRPARMAEMHSRHMAKLHELLKLTAQQEPAWATYQAALAPATTPAHPDHAAMAKLPAPERLARMIDFSKQRTATMETHLAALNTFYATLTAEQKALFDDHVMGGEHGPRHAMMHRHG